MLITADDILRRFRSDVDDVLEGTDEVPDLNSLWKISDTYDYLNAAIEQWATETRSLFSRKSLTVVADNPLISLPQSTRFGIVRRVVLRGRKMELTEYNVDGHYTEILDDYGLQIGPSADFESRTGTPRHYTLNRERNKLALAPTPVAADVLDIDAYLLPSITFPGMPLPLSEYKDQHLVLLWMKKLAYEKQNADTLDLTRATKFEAEFEDRVLARQHEIGRRNTAPRIVRMNW